MLKPILTHNRLFARHLCFDKLKQNIEDGARRMTRPKQGGEAVRRRGRPALPKGAGKRHALGLRVTAECRKALEEAAASSGRSISQEIEFRLERSLQQDAAFGGREMAGLFLMMSGAAALICARRGAKAWSSDSETFLAIRAAWRGLIDQAAPDYTGEIGLLHQPSSSDEAARKAQEADFREWLERAEAAKRRREKIERLGPDVAEALARLRPTNEDR
jgi:hypothetical protein